MGWRRAYLYGAETYDGQRIRVLDEVEPVEIDYTLPTDRPDDFEPARVNPLLRGPVQPAAPSAAGPTPGSPARDTATVTRGTRDPNRRAA